MTRQLKLQSPAKVNIGLQIRGQRPDGYHNIHTVFQELAFSDTVIIDSVDSGCRISADVDWIPTDETNICHAVYRTLKQRFPSLPGVNIHIEKRIPAGAGLGGGSSNGAAVLKGLNKLFRLGLSSDNLLEIGAPLGADIPFFIDGGTQLGEGIGEVLTPLKPISSAYFLLVIPQFQINTGWAYGEVKKHLDSDRKLVNFLGFFQGENTSWKLFENDFERIVIPAYPEIGAIKKQLCDSGAVYASLSGSGSTVYGIFDDEAVARTGESVFKNSYQTILTSPPAH